MNAQEIEGAVLKAVETTPVTDIHTHIYDTGFDSLLLWGVDELLTYHYLVAEVFRAVPTTYERFRSMTKREQANYIWKHLFVERSPLSESCRGVITCLSSLGLDPADRDLDRMRGFFADMSVEKYIDLVFKKANVREVVMTNDPFDDLERPVWEKKRTGDPRFLAALRIDRLLLDWSNSCPRLKSWGYDVEPGLGAWTLREIQRFLEDWAKRMGALYMAASLPPSFRFPDESLCGIILERCVLPVGREKGLPFALMVGVKKLVNPELGLAGDGIGKSDIGAIEHLCVRNPDNKFLVTMLSRENQHELCVTARKFPNLMPFGCWWFLNNPSIIDEMTRERIELLGLSVIPQHSDARVLDQLLYKWTHSRALIGHVLAEKYRDLAQAGWNVDERDISRDVELLFGGVFKSFIGKP